MRFPPSQSIDSEPRDWYYHSPHGVSPRNEAERVHTLFGGLQPSPTCLCPHRIVHRRHGLHRNATEFVNEGENYGSLRYVPLAR